MSLRRNHILKITTNGYEQDDCMNRVEVIDGIAIVDAVGIELVYRIASLLAMTVGVNAYHLSCYVSFPSHLLFLGLLYGQN
ncbi:hypothetical protein [Flavobacterium sp. SM2513]|uniref:hypothetical protein n=1 Tax=Flavobacterium sp. SM2513 TaxID=3424766 RepID=UPI003D7F5BC0